MSLGLYEHSYRQEIERNLYPPLFCIYYTTLHHFCFYPHSSVVEGKLLVGVSSAKGYWDGQDLECAYLWGGTDGHGLVQSWEERVSGALTAAFSRSAVHMEVRGGRMRDNLKSWNERFKLETRKTFFPMRTAQQCSLDQVTLCHLCLWKFSSSGWMKPWGAGLMPSLNLLWKGSWAWELLKSKQPKLYYDFTCDSCSTAEVPRCDLVCLLVLLASSVS